MYATMMKRAKRSGLPVCEILLLLAIALVLSVPLAAQSNDDCMMCHEYPDMERESTGESVFVDLEQHKLYDDSESLPDVILLDLQLPKMSGFDFLRIMKTDSMYRKIPVVVLSAKNDDMTISEAYQNGAAGYITTPGEFTQMLIKLAEFSSYWALPSEVPVCT